MDENTLTFGIFLNPHPTDKTEVPERINARFITPRINEHHDVSLHNFINHNYEKRMPFPLSGHKYFFYTAYIMPSSSISQGLQLGVKGTYVTITC